MGRGIDSRRRKQEAGGKMGLEEGGERKEEGRERRDEGTGVNGEQGRVFEGRRKWKEEKIGSRSEDEGQEKIRIKEGGLQERGGRKEGIGKRSKKKREEKREGNSW